MNRDVTAALRLALPGHLSLRKSRLESFCVRVVGVLLSRTVNLSHLALHVSHTSRDRLKLPPSPTLLRTGHLIPTRADPHALAQSRRPMDMMIQGWSMRRFHAEQQWSTMSA